jgi:iron(III)-enterobactin esterase
LSRRLSITFLITLITGVQLATAQTPAAAPRPRPTPPTRDPHSPGYAKELPDGANAPANVDGNFILGPTHNPAPETTQEGVPKGTISNFTMESADSKFYPGIAR